MAYKLINECPVCGSQLNAVKLTCKTCGTIIESEFELSRFETLNKEQLAFAEVFIKNRGIIKDVEKEMGISYPTVRAKLDDVIKSLGYEVKDELFRPGRTEISEVIDNLEKGEIDIEEAIRKIKK
jgi:hypothetical protein